YRKVGAASWYGDAFHGRLTANGEIYDMTHLTAAHPTMPLPSYARVTNMKNGSSVIVRVNDRGPYANGRIIDLSKRAAEMLDYSHAGVAKVKVEYVGRAPLDGQDDRYLMASYRPGKGQGRAPDPLSDGLPSGVMIAMNGPTPSGDVGGGAFAFGDAAGGGGLVAQTTFQAVEPMGVASVLLPDAGPIVPERPFDGFQMQQTQLAMVTSYADERVKRASNAFASFDRVAAPLTPDEMSTASTEGGDNDADYIAAGAFGSRAEAEKVAAALASMGRPAIAPSAHDGGTWYELTIMPDGRASIDDLLEAAWQNGAPDALTVRD
ncbi:MAG: septal ring lytic transglycosylase RlpA family protein, partial [Rhizobiaceae bacterium]